jgi:hypothetical protein
MNVYVSLGLHLVFAILWFFDSRTLRRRRDIKRYYEAEGKMNAILDQAAKTLITELDSWRLEKERNKTPDGMELHELSQKIAYEQMKSRWNHPTNNRRTDFDIDITHILEEKMAKRKAARALRVKGNPRGVSFRHHLPENRKTQPWG